MSDQGRRSRLTDPDRLAVLESILAADPSATASFDRLAALAARALQAPVAQVNVVSSDRQVSLSSVGPHEWARPGAVGLEYSYCRHVVETGEPVVVEDARSDARVRDSHATTERGIVAYAAVPVTVEADLVLGTVCVVDFAPRSWTHEDIALLEQVASHVAMEIERRGHSRSELLHLMAVLEGSSDALIGLDVDGRVRSWNAGAEALLGYTAAEIIGGEYAQLVPEQNRERTRQRLQKLRGGERIARVETEVLRRDGATLPISVVATPVTDLAGRTVGSTLVVRDIAERLAAEQRFHQAQKMEAIGRLTGGIAHDFNNLLTVIHGNAQLAADALEPGSEPRADLEEVLRSCGRAASLIRQLLAFSKQQVLRPRPVNLNDVIINLEPMLGRLIGEDVAITLRLAGSMGFVAADPTQVEQVLMNLAVNARDAMPGGGRLVIETRMVNVGDVGAGEHGFEFRPGSYAVLSVTDTGEGIPPDMRQRIFDPFFTTKEPGKGTGLGLSTVYGIVKQSDGYIFVYSELGQGTTFKIYLPEVEEGESMAATAAEAVDQADGSGRTVLLVEDEDAVRKFAARVLGRAGYVVLEASSGTDALDVAAAHEGTIDVLLTDVIMPGMTGPVLAEQLRAERPNLCVVLTSGYPREEVAQRGRLPGGVNFIEKPYSTDALVEVVRAALNGG